MKNIQAQYRDLLEGKMSPANFMVNVRRDFPQWVSPVNTFKDAVSILKSKRILNEDVTPSQLGAAQDEFDASQQDTDNGSSDSETISEVTHVTPEAIEKALKDMWEDGLIDDMTWKTASKALTHFNVDDHMNMAGTSTADDLARELVLVATGDNVPDMEDDSEEDYDDLRADDQRFNSKYESLNEAAMWNPNAEAPQEVGYDQVNYRQLMKGMEFELSKAPEITDEALVKAKQKALKNLKKDPNFYRNLLIANVEDVDKMDKTLRQTPVKGDNMVDKANAMKVIKKDVKGNVQDTLGKKERAKKKDGEGIKQMTQTPKKVKGVQAFDTPGKEKVTALKEHIMNEFGGHNNQFATPQFSIGSRVESRDGKLVGEIVEFDNHTATVKEDGTGKMLHVQPNILQHSSAAQKPHASQVPADHLKNMPGLGSVKGSDDKLKKLAGLKEKLMKAIEEDLEEGAVAQTASGVTVASGKNPGDVAKRAMDLKQQTGDSFTVLDTKAGTRRKI